MARSTPVTSGFDAADEDGDGFISVVEGVPSYGGIAVSLTTEGDTSPDSGLAVDRFPTSGTARLRAHLRAAAGGRRQPQPRCTSWSTPADLDGSGEIGDMENEDGTMKQSSLDPELDIEATTPAACGQIAASSAAGGVATGAGGSADSGSTTGAIVAGALGLAALGTAAARRRVTA